MEQEVARDRGPQIGSKKDKEITVVVWPADSAQGVSERYVEIGEGDTCEPLCNKNVRSLEDIGSLNWSGFGPLLHLWEVSRTPQVEPIN